MSETAVRLGRVGRAAECARIEKLLADASAGRPGSLLLLGDPGIGKTALLEHGIAAAAGWTIVSARGVESESELPYSGLLELLRPLLGGLPSLPARQADALASALAIGPATGADPFAVAAATLTLLADAALERPLLIVVDDLPWVDDASTTAILFALRRFATEPIAGLLAARPEVGDRSDRFGIPVLSIGPLDRDACLALLDRAAPGPRSAEVTERLIREAGGNPLALLELPRLIPPERLSGAEPLDEAPLRVSDVVERAYARRVATLPYESQTALLIAAACEVPTIELIARALATLGMTVDALDPAEGAGLIEIGSSRVAFHHPLVRSAIYYREEPTRRRIVHAAVAAALAARPGAADGRRAWHLAAAAFGPDEGIAAELDEAALAASRRSAFGAAARAYERAAELSPDTEAAASRFLAAGRAWGMTSGSVAYALEMLAQAASTTRDRVLAARIELERGRIDTWRGPALDAYDRLCRAADEVVELDPTLAAAMLAQAGAAAITGGDLGRGIRAAQAGYDLASSLGGSAEFVAALQLGKLRVLVGEVMTGLPLILGAIEMREVGDDLEHASLLAQCSPALMTAERYELAEAILSKVVAAQRSANALGLLAYSLGGLAELQSRTGRWSESYANGSEACVLARESAQDGQLSYNLARLARLEAARGLEDPCRSHAAEGIALAGPASFGSTLPFAESALGLLELGFGRPDEAIVHLERTRELWAHEGFRDPGRLEWDGDLIEAYVRTGRSVDGLAALDALEDETARFSRPRTPGAPDGRCALTSAVAARCRGLMAGDDDIDEVFAQALGLHSRTTVPFEEARTALCYGERLRRAGRRIDARVQLRAALDAFDRLEAAPWLARARAELVATGEKMPELLPRAERPLTPQELQVALLVSRGATNREAAAALFLTPKTIEFHLAKIYRKLDLRSRTELAGWAAHHLAIPVGA